MDRAHVVVAGGGYVGLSTALAMKASAPGLDVVLVDAAPADAVTRDTRASAIAAAAARMLDRLGVWERLAGGAQPITEMIVTDSRTEDPVRPVFLTFGEAGDPTAGEPFAHMVQNRDLVAALRERAQAEGVRLVHATTVDGFRVEPTHVDVDLSDGATLRAELLAAADGVNSKLRALAGIGTLRWSYGQKGIVATVAHEHPHEGRAFEHFLPGGPFATLPLPGNRSSLVWTEPDAVADRLVRADEFTFELELERRFGPRFGELTLESKPRAWPLGLTLARDFVRPRVALVGDAAHGIHPIAGQGLNLGFKDAAALAQTVVEAHRIGLDVGALNVLENYQRWRRFDTVRMGAVTDVLNRLFSNDIAPVRLARQFGLGLVDRMPALKRAFIEQAAGRSATAPALLQGRPI